MNNDISKWEDLEFFKKNQYQKILDLIQADRNSGISILPDDENILNALTYTPWDAVKVIILGQDPYPNKKHAHGLAFSIPETCEDLPRSLKNILKELEDDIGVIKTNGNLTDWAKEGVLLLNLTLTVEEGKPGSHKRKGWDKLTKEILQKLNDYRRYLVFILWGKPAQSLAGIIDPSKHLILESAHPSPQSSYRGFFGSKPFSKTNAYLVENQIEPINWGK